MISLLPARHVENLCLGPPSATLVFLLPHQNHLQLGEIKVQGSRVYDPWTLVSPASFPQQIYFYVIRETSMAPSRKGQSMTRMAIGQEMYEYYAEVQYITYHPSGVIYSVLFFFFGSTRCPVVFDLAE
jgi:hypothetical protein